MNQMLSALDQWIFTGINQGLRNGSLDRIMPAVSNPVFLVLPGVLLLWWLIYKATARGRWAVAAVVIVFLIGDGLSAQVIKPFFARPRPYEVLGDAHVYKDGWKISGTLTEKNTLSFPSNHAVNSAAAATILAFFFRRGRWLWAALAAAVCFSRVYLGLHWPSDVGAGALVGLGLAGGFLALQNGLGRCFPNRLKWLAEEVRS